MELPNNIISQFVKITNDDNKKEPQTKTYGTVVIQGEDQFVRLDGSDLLTPIESTVFINDGDRVSVTVKNHNVTIDGNFSDISASNDYVLSVDDDITRLILDVDGILTDVREVTTKNEEMNTKVNDMESKVNDMESIVNGVDGKTSSLEMKNETQDAKIQTIENNVKTINSDLSSTNTEVKNNAANIQRVETKVGECHNYIYHGTVTVDVASYTTVDLPGEIAYKKGTDYAVILHVKDYSFGDTWGTIVTQRMMVFVSSRTNISFKIRTLIIGLDIATGEQINTGTATINYTIIA